MARFPAGHRFQVNYRALISPRHPKRWEIMSTTPSALCRCTGRASVGEDPEHRGVVYERLRVGAVSLLRLASDTGAQAAGWPPVAAWSKRQRRSLGSPPGRPAVAGHPISLANAPGQQRRRSGPGRAADSLRPAARRSAQAEEPRYRLSGHRACRSRPPRRVAGAGRADLRCCRSATRMSRSRRGFMLGSASE